MNKKTAAYLLALFLIGLISTGCRSGLKTNQIEFGIMAAQKGLWNEAIFRWEKVVQSNPNSASAHNNLAVAYENRGLWEEAKKEYEIALELSPKNTYIQSNYENFKKHLEGQKDKEQTKKDEKK